MTPVAIRAERVLSNYTPGIFSARARVFLVALAALSYIGDTYKPVNVALSHGDLLRFSRIFEHPDREGICLGGSLAAEQDFLSENVELFESRFQKIKQLFQKMNKLGISLKKDLQSTEENRERVKLLAESIEQNFHEDLSNFFWRANVNQAGGDYKDLFDKENIPSIKSQRHLKYAEVVSAVTAPKELAVKGGLKEVGRSQIYTEKNLVQFFLSLKKSLDEKPLQVPVALTISSTHFNPSNGHAIASGYHSKIGKYWLFDINKVGSLGWKKNETFLAREVFSSLYSNESLGTIRVDVHAAGEDLENLQNMTIWQNREDFLGISKRSSEEIKDIFKTAIVGGNVVEIQNLLETSVDVNKKAAIATAAFFGHEKIVQLLLEKEVSVTEASLYWASNGGHIKVVQLLLEKEDTLENIRYVLREMKGKEDSKIFMLLKEAEKRLEKKYSFVEFRIEATLLIVYILIYRNLQALNVL